MDSPYFLTLSDTSTSAATSSLGLNQLFGDLEQSTSSSSASPFGYDPFDGFSFHHMEDDHHYHHHQSHGSRLDDYFGSSGRSSPIMNQYPLDVDHLVADVSHHSHHNHHHHHHHNNSNHHNHHQPHLQQRQQTIISSTNSNNSVLKQSNKNSLFQADPTSQDENDDDLRGTLTSFVGCGADLDSDAGYNSGVDLFSSSSIVDTCSDSTEAYCFRLALEHATLGGATIGGHQHDNLNGYSSDNNTMSTTTSASNSSYGDIINNNDYYFNSGFNNYDCNSDRNTSPNSVTTSINNRTSSSSLSSSSSPASSSTSEKRSVLMNLLIDGSDVGAGYTSINCRALQSNYAQRPQRAAGKQY